MTSQQASPLRIGDRVQERISIGDRNIVRTNSPTLAVQGPRLGRIVALETRTDRRGHSRQYASVQWDHLKSPSLHACFRIVAIPPVVHSQQQQPRCDV